MLVTTRKSFALCFSVIASAMILFGGAADAGPLQPGVRAAIGSELLHRVATGGVTGRNAIEVRHPDGVFRKQGSVWLEYDAAGKAGFTFEEAGRDDWSVYLRDASRNVVLQLDLHQKKIFYSDDANPKAQLYDIIDATADASAPAPLQPAGAVDGRTAMEVRHPEGVFRRDGSVWLEYDLAGKAGFTFEEAGRDDWSVYLRDASRNVVLQLDLHQKKIFYSDDTNQKVPLYDIIGAGTDAATAPPVQHASTVDGRTVTEVRHPEGVFRKQGLVWLEYDTTGKAGFTFEEAGRDDWSVYLRDTSRNVVLQLDLHQKKIFYSDDTNQKVPLYEIESASAIGDAVMAPDSAPSPALTPAQGVNGLNVGEVRHANGSFRQQANGWAEIDVAGVTGFLFTETGRDEWSVYLKDPSRDVTIQLDLYQKQIFYSDNNNPRAPLYDIVSAAAGGGAATGGAAPQPQDTSVAGTANGSDGREIAFPTNGEIQCVKNIVGSAIAANVKWYHPNDFEQVPGSAGTFRLKAGAIPAQEDNTVATPLPGKNRSCIRADVRMTAIVRVIGAKLATSSVKITAGTLIAVGGAVACVGTKGVACPAVAAVVTSLAEGGISFIPEAVEGDFYVGAPGQVEVYGSAFDPSWRETRAWGTGILAGERCTANSDCRNAQCGRLSASDADANNRQCCPDGRVAMMYIGNGKDYCNKMPNGSACYLNDHCASNRCANNAGGLKRGVCK